jgi:cyanate permease
MFYGAFLTIALGISALSTTVLMTALGNWFDRKIGLVSGIAASGFGFGGLLIPVVVKLVDSWGWQTATAALGLGLLVVAAPLGSLFRHKPEHYGYLPDGEVKSPAATGANPDVPRISLKDVGIRRVLRSSAFWYMTIAFGCQLLVAQAVFTHVMPYLSSVEVSRSISSSVATFVPVASVVGRLGIGWLGDKLDSRLVTVATFAMVCSGLIIFEYVTSAEMWLLVPFVILFGIGHGGIVSLRPSLIRKFFGRASFGTIFGFVIGLIVLLSMAGPPLAGWVFDYWGSYQNTWLAFAGLVGVAALSITAVPRVGANRESAEDADSA